MANRFDGRVVIVTGAGAGLGRAYALLFASRGASVVVNDLGGSRSGDGKSTMAADNVVNEIIAAGGKAVPDYNSVIDGHKIVETALKKFGKVDILVNNAGILKDKSVGKMSEDDWNAVHNVHLKGAFMTTRAAWPIFQKQKYGKIIVTSSNSGLYGNFGQVNYSSAKMGLVGLCNTIAIEGRKYNISCNVIVPTAASRLTEDILPPDLFKELRPELIAPVVCWMCHENCEDSGIVVESAGGWATRYALVRGRGVTLRKKLNEHVTIENVRNEWSNITDLSKAEKMSSIQEATGTLMTHLEGMRIGSDNTLDSTGGEECYYHNITFKDSIIYALGIGASVKNSSDMKYLYENHDNFCTFPTMGIIPGQIAISVSALMTSAIPGKAVDFTKILHGEQYLEMYKPMPTNCTLRNEVKIAGVLDKGKHAVILVEAISFNESDEKICFNQMAVIVTGAGGFGGPRQSSANIEPVNPPKRQPDSVVSELIPHDQAAIYRMSGDLNPLHIDSNFAALGGFQTPILHGLCSLGFSARHVLSTFGNNDPGNFKCIKARFTKPVFPGDTLTTEMWREKNRIHFRTLTQTGNEAISGAYVDLHKVIFNDELQSNASTDKVKLLSDAVFQSMNDSAKLRNASQLNAIFVFNITDNTANILRTWTVDFKKGELYEGNPKKGEKPNVNITATDKDLLDMGMGKITPQAAYMKGKLKIQGSLALATKLKDYIVMKSKF